MHSTSSVSTVQPPWIVIEQGAYRFPPGLKLNLPFYLLRRFVKPGNPIILFEHLAETFGGIAQYRLGRAHFVLINEPDFVREILVQQPQNFIKERTQRRMKILLGEGLITSDGETHKRQRRIAAPAFHRQRVQDCGAMMVDRAAALRLNWRPDQPFDIASAMMELSLQVVARTLFNADVTEEVLQISRQVNTVMELYNFLIALPYAEAYLNLPIPGLVRFRRARALLDSVVHRMIASHRADGVDRGDLLSMLISSRDEEADRSRMTDEQLRDEVLTIFLAGYETVANALTWTWYLLSQNPDAEAAFHAEIDQVLGGRLPTVEDVPRLRYTERVFAESMRLYPPAWAMGRESITDVEIGPYRFPRGVSFFFSQYIIQRSARFFPDPLRFDPDRFLPEQKANRPRFSYFPFGAGSRQCIGEAFAWMEGVLLLSTIAQQWRFQLIPGQTVEVQPKITLRPRHPILVLPQLRNSAG